MYVYRHRRIDKNEIFYIGIGKGNRAYNTHSRNKYWKNITKKTDYVVEILIDNISLEDAYELEIFLIELYGRKDLKTGNLVNLTIGGDGCNGAVRTKEWRNKISESKKGKKLSIETKKKISDKNSGKNHPMFGRINEKCYMFGKTAINAVIVVDIENNVEYSSIYKAAKKLNINYNTFYKKLKEDQYENIKLKILAIT